METTHYTVQATEWKTRFKVAHAATNKLVTPFYNRCSRPITERQAEHIAEFCEKHAPYNDPGEAVAALNKVGYQDKLAAFVNRTGAMSVRKAFPLPG
jgi:precorrin-3B methylase